MTTIAGMAGSGTVSAWATGSCPRKEKSPGLWTPVILAMRVFIKRTTATDDDDSGPACATASGLRLCMGGGLQTYRSALMLTRSRRTLGLAAVAIAVLSLGAGAQGRGNGHDKDKDKGDKGKDDEHRVVVVSPGNVIVRRVPGTIIDRRVPPGLAKKPGGMPPGQYKKLYGPNDGVVVMRDVFMRRGYTVVRTAPYGTSQYVYYRSPDGSTHRAIVSPGSTRLTFSNVPPSLLSEILSRLP